MIKLLLGCLLVGLVVAEEFPVKIAGKGRLHLVVPEGSQPLSGAAVSVGSVSRGEWLEDEAARERLVDVVFPVDWWCWREVRLSFTAGSDGEIELFLNGIWEEKEPGVLWRNEVLWDDVEVKGMEVPGGDFGQHGVGWESPWREYPAAWGVASVGSRGGSVLAWTAFG